MKEKSPFMPTTVSILAVIIWATSMLLYVLIWSSNFHWLQNLAVIVLSLVAVGGLVGLMWVFWRGRERAFYWP